MAKNGKTATAGNRQRAKRCAHKRLLMERDREREKRESVREDWKKCCELVVA